MKEVAQLTAEINLHSNDIENDFDSKSLDLGFLIEKRGDISGFSYKFLSDCQKGFAFPYSEDYERNKPPKECRIRTWQTSFGFPNRYSKKFLDKYYTYTIDGHLEQMAQISSHHPVNGKTLYMVVSSTLLNGKKFKPYPDSDYEMPYFRPLYIGQTDNLYKRWKNHHKREQFNFLCQLDIELFLLMYFVYEEDENLEKLEKILIKELNPLMNDTPTLVRKKKISVPNVMQGKVFPNSIFPSQSQNDIGQVD